MTNLLKQDHVLLILHKYLRELIGVFNMYANLDGLTAIKGTQTATKKSDGDAIADKLNSYEAKEHEALDEKATMTLAEFANLMKDARLLGHRQTRLVFAQAQQAVVHGGESSAEMVSLAGTFASSSLLGEGVDNEFDDENELDFGEYLDSLIRVSLWKYQDKTMMPLANKIQSCLTTVAGLYGKKRQSQRTVPTGLSGEGKRSRTTIPATAP